MLHLRRLNTFTEESECSCFKCVDACKRPCWPTPKEAQAIIDAGYGSKLMADYWQGSPTDNGYEDVEILCGANPGYEGQNAPEVGFMAALGGYNPLFTGCTFLSKDLCILHDLKLKPSEGKLSLPCKDTSPDLHQALAIEWESKEGKIIVSNWKKSI